MGRRFLWVGRLAIAGLAVVPAVDSAGDVNVNVNIGTPPAPAIVIAEPPRLRQIPRSSVYYAPSVPYNFFYYGGRYYAYQDEGWFWGVSVRGPWTEISIGNVPRPVLAVPVAYYKVPPGHWKKHGPPPWAGNGRGHGKGHKHGRGHKH